MKMLKVLVALRLVAGSFISLILLCSCATEPAVHRSLPANVPISKDAGRGGFLVVTVRLEDGQKLPMILDTGAGGTLFDKSLEPKLGKPLGTTWPIGGAPHCRLPVIRRQSSIWEARC